MYSIEIPRAHEAERRMLNILITSKDGHLKVTKLKPFHFYNDDHRTIFEACNAVAAEGKDVDLISVCDILEKRGDNDAMWASKVADVTIEFCSSAHTSVIEEQIIEAYRKRRLIEVSESTMKRLTQGEESQPILEKISEDVIDITEDIEENPADISTLADLFVESLKAYKEKQDSGQNMIGISTGIEELDEVTEGLREGQMWVLGAMTSGGKSAFMMNVVDSVLKQGKKASVYSLEMNQNAIIARLLGIRMNTSATDIVKLVADKNKVWEHIKQLKDEGLKIYGTEMENLDHMMMSIVRDVSRGQTDAVFIDYIQLMGVSGNMKSNEKLEHIARQLRLLASRTGVPIFILSQLNNESVNNPQETAGFMGSGAIAQSANVGIVLRPDVERNIRKELHKKGMPIPTKIDIIKSQDSAVGYINCSFVGKTGVFKSVTDGEYAHLKEEALRASDDFSDFDD